MRRVPLQRGGPIRPVSAARAAENRQRRAVLDQLAQTQPWCSARVPDVCTGRAQDGHELLRRSQGGSITDPNNVVGVCRPCHGWIGEHPAQAVARGLARWGMRAGSPVGVRHG
jgi:hypothetical protein